MERWAGGGHALRRSADTGRAGDAPDGTELDEPPGDVDPADLAGAPTAAGGSGAMAGGLSGPEGVVAASQPTAGITATEPTSGVAAAEPTGSGAAEPAVRGGAAEPAV